MLIDIVSDEEMDKKYMYHTITRQTQTLQNHLFSLQWITIVNSNLHNFTGPLQRFTLQLGNNNQTN